MPLERAARVVAQLAKARESKDLAALVGREIESLGYPGFSMGVISSKSDDWVMRPRLTNLGSVAEACDQDDGPLARSPVIARLRAGIDLIAWTAAEFSRDASFADYSAFLNGLGIGGGVSIALVRGSTRVCAISAVRPAADAHDPQVCRAIALIGHALVLHEGQELALEEEAGPQAAPRLTPRQLDILAWAAEGKSNGVIAEIIGLRQSTVAYHMSAIIRELGVASRGQAIAWYIANRHLVGP